VDKAHTIEAQLRAARALESSGRTAEATHLFRQAAASGDRAATAALGKHLLIFRPDCAGEGLNALAVAAQRGDGESAHLVAVFIAEGVGFPQNWQAALAALHHSAELGFRPARREIALLRTIDVSAWLRAPPADLASPDPRILVVKNFAPAAICDWLIELARPRLKAAQTFDPETGGKLYESSRTNSDSHLILPYSDLVLSLVRARIAALIEMPVPFFEPPTVLHYAVGEAFHVHHDFLDDTKPGLANEIGQNGQRVATFLLTLNEGFDGGETEFPLLGLRFKGKKGDAICFWNVKADGSPHRRTLHAGLPPTSGEKWLLSQWVRNTAMNAG
jgi:prolyl 4-hydroxylase